MFLLFLPTFAILVAEVSATKLKTGFYAGRIKPSRFEYAEINGWMLPQNAVEICEKDFACAGFTFRGAYSIDYQPVEVYFFHYIKDAKPEENYYHWSTYRVKRNHVSLQDFSVKSDPTISNHCDPRSLEEFFQENPSFAAIKVSSENSCDNPRISINDCEENELKTCLTKLDFKNLVHKQGSKIIINLNPKSKNKISHTLDPVDRCCKLNGRKVAFDGIDDFPRIPCDVDKESFEKHYVKKREPVMMLGCTENWPAKNWTSFTNVVDRFHDKLSWEVLYQTNKMDSDAVAKMNKHEN